MTERKTLAQLARTARDETLFIVDELIVDGATSLSKTVGGELPLRSGSLSVGGFTPFVAGEFYQGDRVRFVIDVEVEDVHVKVVKNQGIATHRRKIHDARVIKAAVVEVMPVPRHADDE